MIWQTWNSSILIEEEFDNQLIDDILEGFGITRSLSQSACPYDNAVAVPMAPLNLSL